MLNESDVSGDTSRQVILLLVEWQQQAGWKRREEVEGEKKKRTCRALGVMQRVSIHRVMSCLAELPPMGSMVTLFPTGQCLALSSE